MYSWNSLLGTFMKQLQTVTLLHYVCPSLHPSMWNNLAPTGWIFVKFDTGICTKIC